MLRQNVALRGYQANIIDSFSKTGVIVLPCGAGKSLAAIGVMAKILQQVAATSRPQDRLSCAVVCYSNEACVYWKEEILRWTTARPERVVIVEKAQDLSWVASNPTLKGTGVGLIIVVTYSLIYQYLVRMNGALRTDAYIVDEAHYAPAEHYQQIFEKLRDCEHRIGLTATPTRGDNCISLLKDMVGELIYTVNWKHLEADGYLAAIKCNYIVCPKANDQRSVDEMLELEGQAPHANAHVARNIMSLMNPAKMAALQSLLDRHRGAKIIIFVDYIQPLLFYGVTYRGFIYCGKTSKNERVQVLKAYREHPECSLLFMSKIGDTGINLPEAEVVIELGAFDTSQTQLTQRIGRVSRPKAHNGNRAWHYALLEDSDHERSNFAERIKFMEENEYRFNRIPFEDVVDFDLGCIDVADQTIEMLRQSRKQEQDPSEDRSIE